MYDSIQYLQYGAVIKTVSPIGFDNWSTHNPGLTMQISYTPYGSTQAVQGASAVKSWLTSSGFRK